MHMTPVLVESVWVKKIPFSKLNFLFKNRENVCLFLPNLAEFDKISSALPQVKGLGELSDLELDKLAVEAEESYKNLMDLGMNVDSRYSGRIFEVASTMLRNAIDAKSNKIDKKLKMVELQLKKQKIDQGNKDDTGIEEQDGFVISDRNELMKKLLKKD